MGINTPRRTAFLLSGSGSTVDAILTAISNHQLTGIEPVVAISSSKEAVGLQKAEAHGLQTYVVDPKAYSAKTTFETVLLDILKSQSISLISQNGWLPLTPPAVVEQYKGNIINQHPGPLDIGRSDFGGKGMFGKRVTCARILYVLATGKEYWTESTVHYVTEEFDKGEVIGVKKCAIPHIEWNSFDQVRKDPTTIMRLTQQIQQSLLPIEHANVTQTLQHIADNDIQTITRNQPLIKPQFESVLTQAKQLAIELFPTG